jgi:hypothetical protein
MFDIACLSIPDADIDDIAHVARGQCSTPGFQTSILLFPAAHDVGA